MRFSRAFVAVFLTSASALPHWYSSFLQREVNITISAREINETTPAVLHQFNATGHVPRGIKSTVRAENVTFASGTSQANLTTLRPRAINGTVFVPSGNLTDDVVPRAKIISRWDNSTAVAVFPAENDTAIAAPAANSTISAREINSTELHARADNTTVVRADNMTDLVARATNSTVFLSRRENASGILARGIFWPFKHDNSTV